MLATLAASLFIFCGIMAFPMLLFSVVAAVGNFRRVPARRIWGLAFLIVALIIAALFVALFVLLIALWNDVQRPYTQSPSVP